MSYSLARLEGRAKDNIGSRRSKRKRVNVPKHIYDTVIEAIDDDGSSVMVFIDKNGKVCREFEVRDIETSKKQKITKNDLNDLLNEPDAIWEKMDKREEEKELQKLGIIIKKKTKDKPESESESEYQSETDEETEEDEISESEYEVDCLNDSTDSEAEQEAQKETEFDNEIKEFYQSDEDAD